MSRFIAESQCESLTGLRTSRYRGESLLNVSPRVSGATYFANGPLDDVSTLCCSLSLCGDFFVGVWGFPRTRNVELSDSSAIEDLAAE